MSTFDTPQRMFADATKIENQYKSTPEISSLVDKLQEANFTPSKRIPLGLMFEANRGILASGAQRVLVKEKEAVKTPKSAGRGKTNFMKPTEAFRNGHVPTTTPSKSPKTVSAPMSGPHVTPSSKTPSSASSSTKKSIVSPAVNKVHTPSTPLVNQHPTVETPLRAVTSSQPRSTSTPPSTKRPSAVGSVRKTPEESGIKRRLESPKRVTNSSNTAAPTSHNILFSPPRGNQRAVDDSILSGGVGDVSLMLHSTPQRAQSNPRPARHSNASEHQTGVDELSQNRKPAVPVFDLRPRKSVPVAAAAPPAADGAEKRKAPVPHQQVAPLAAAIKPSEGSAGVTPSGSASKSNSSSSGSGPARFKNPPPSSVLVTTADTLSANKAAKKAVHASLFKSPAIHVTHHYSAPAPISAPVGSTPGSSASGGSANVNGTPSRKVKTASTEQIVEVVDESSPSNSRPALSHKSASTNSLFGAVPSVSSLTAPTVSSAKKVKKIKKVTISGNSPTILSSASVPLQPPVPPLTSNSSSLVKLNQRQGDLDVENVLKTLNAASVPSGDNHTVDNIDHSRSLSQSPHHALDYLSDVHRSASFGSELSSLRGYPTDVDLSMADTIDLSNNTSSIMIHDYATGASPFEPHLLPSGTPISAITHASTGTNAARRSLNRDTLARMELDENLLNVSAVEPALSYSPSHSQHSGLVSFGSLSAFTPIPPVQVATRSKPARHHHNTATVTSRSTEYTNFYAQYSEGSYAYGAVPSLVRSSSSQHPYVGPIRKSSSTGNAMAAMSPLTPHSVVGAPFDVSRQSSLNNASFTTTDDVGDAESGSVASSNVLNRGMMMSSSYSVTSDLHAFTGGDLMLNISGCGSLASYSVAPVTPSNALNTAMLMSQSRSDGSPLKIELSNSILSGTSSMLNTLASAHNVLNTGMFQSGSPDGSPEKDLVMAGNRVQCFSSDSQSMLSEIPVAQSTGNAVVHCEESADGTLSRLDKLQLSDYVRPDHINSSDSYLECPGSCVSRGGPLNRTITMNPQDIHCVELEGESELLDETEDEEVEPVFVVDMTSTAILNPRSGEVTETSDPFEVSENKGSSGDVPNMTLSNSESCGIAIGAEGSMDDSMNQALDFVDNLVITGESERSDPFLPQQVDSNSSLLNQTRSDGNDEADAVPSFEFSEHHSEDNDMVMLSDHDEIEEQAEENEVLLSDDEDPPGPPPLEELMLPPPEYTGFQPRRSACSPIPHINNVTESFEFKPRSLSMLPVPASIALTPVTKSYLDIERHLRNQHSASPRKVSSHLNFEPYETVDDLHEDISSVVNAAENNDEEEEDFVSTLPLVPSQLPPSQVIYQQDSLDLSRSNIISGHPHANTSLVSINTSGYNSSLCSNTSSVDELQRLNPRSKSSQWFSHHYQSTGASVNPSSTSKSLRGVAADPLSMDEFDHSASDMKVFQPREDLSTVMMCPDPVARQLSDEVAAPSTDEKDFKPVSGFFKLH